MTRDYLKFMTSDLLMQFRGENCKNNIVLLSALARQLDDVFEMFQQLEERTYLRRLTDNESGESLNHGAHGIQLDRIGEVVDLTRKQATIVSSKIESVDDIEKSGSILDDTLMSFIKENFAMYYPGDSLGDAEYSEYLYYKIFLNSSYCTYDDVIKSLKMFWTKTPIYYQEKPEEPATIFLSTPDLKPEQNARIFFLAPVVKAAGVRILREAVTVDKTRSATSYFGTGLFSGVIQATLPQLIIEHNFNNTLSANTRVENVATNIIPHYGMFTTFRENDSLYIAIKKSEYNKYSSLVYPAMYNGELIKGVVSPYYNEIDTSCGECCVEEVSIPQTAEVIGGFHRFRRLKSVKLPSSAKTLLGSCFFGCNSLEVVVIPFDSNISEIPSRCFECCVSLKEIMIPETVTAIKTNAFTNCVNLKKVFFGGTQEQWESIKISSGNDCLNEVEIEYLGGLAL